MKAAALLLALTAPGAGLACEPVPAPGAYVPVDRPVAVQPDGSFWNASRDDDWADLAGNPVRDIGGGRVGQVLGEHVGSCTVDQRLLVVDCTRAEAILVHGLRREPSVEELHGAAVTESTLLLQPPHGPLALTPATTVAEIAALAQSEGWTVRTDVAAWAAERGLQNAVDPFLGCEIFYPGSLGARQ